MGEKLKIFTPVVYQIFIPLYSSGSGAGITTYMRKNQVCLYLWHKTMRYEGSVCRRIKIKIFLCVKNSNKQFSKENYKRLENICDMQKYSTSLHIVNILNDV